MTGDPVVLCVHCRGVEPSPLAGLRLTAVFTARYSGQCAVREEDRVSVGEMVGYVVVDGDPDEATMGVACGRCTAALREVGK